ncbi:MAG: MFS transporter [Chloroflexota bacterium]
MAYQNGRAVAVPLILVGLGFVSLGVPEGSLGVAWPSIRASFSLPLDALGLLFGSFASGYVVSSGLSGRIFARLGIGTALSLSSLAGGASLLGYSVAPSWPTMVVLAGVLGVGAGTIDAGLNSYTAIQYSSRVLNWMHAAFGIGAAIAPVLMTSAITSGFGWQHAYAAFGVAQMCLGIGYGALRNAFATRRSLRGTPPLAGRPLASEPLDPVSSEQSQTPAVSARAARTRDRSWRSNPSLWIAAAVFFVYVGVEATVGQWTFTLVTLGDSQPAALAGLMISAYWGSLTVGRLLFGAIAPHVRSQTLLRVSMLGCLVAAALLPLGGPVLHLLAVPVLGLLLAPIFPVLIAETPARLGEAHTADAVGIQVAAAILGGAAIPATVGVLAERVGLNMIGVCCVAAAAAQLTLYEVLVRRASVPR